MKLTLRPDYSFSLTLEGYQFPSLKDVPYDSNWLNVRIDVHHPDGHYTRLDPALLTYEVQRLAKWFRELATGGERSIDFLEPCLQFEVVRGEGSSESVKVTLAHEFRPPWSRMSSEELELIFPLAAVNPAEVAADLERELALYPQRTAS